MNDAEKLFAGAPNFYTFTEEDRAFLTDLVRARIPINMDSIVGMVQVAKEYKVGLPAANNILNKFAFEVAKIFKEAQKKQSDIIIVPGGAMPKS